MTQIEKSRFAEDGLPRETTGLGRNRLFEYAPYLRLFQDDGSEHGLSADDLSADAAHRARTRG